MVTRDELRQRISEDMIDYLNEPFGNGTEDDLRAAIITLYEMLKEDVEWYTTNGEIDGTGATLQLVWEV